MNLELVQMLAAISGQPMLAAISGQGMVQSVIYLIVAGLIFGLLWWLISYAGLPAPFDKVARVVLAILAVLLIINVLLTLVGHPIIKW